MVGEEGSGVGETINVARVGGAVGPYAAGNARSEENYVVKEDWKRGGEEEGWVSFFLAHNKVFQAGGQGIGDVPYIPLIHEEKGLLIAPCRFHIASPTTKLSFISPPSSPPPPRPRFPSPSSHTSVFAGAVLVVTSKQTAGSKK